MTERIDHEAIIEKEIGTVGQEAITEKAIEIVGHVAITEKAIGTVGHERITEKATETIDLEAITEKATGIVGHGKQIITRNRRILRIVKGSSITILPKTIWSFAQTPKS